MRADATQFFIKAKENLTAARLCFDDNLFNACVNRAYYAMLQAALAILIEKGFPMNLRRINHALVHSTFSRELISQRKLIPSRFKSYLHDAQSLRNTADYETEVMSAKSARRQLILSEQFVSLMRQEIGHA